MPLEPIAAVALQVIVPVLPTMVAIGLCGLLERRWPVNTAASPVRWQNVGVWLTSFLVQFVFTPALGGFTTLAVNAVGGGLIELPSSGWALILGVAVYLVAMDFGEYAFHRAQHAVPALWAMHSLHHSDPHFDASTTVRHFWVDPLLKTATVWLAVGLVFKASPLIVGLYMAFTFYNFFNHANVRFGFGRASWVLNSPQYHRLHHGATHDYFDINFAALLPVFDVIFGTYRRPRADEYPATGLDSGEAPKSLVEAIAWPVRKRISGKAGEAAAVAPAEVAIASAPSGRDRLVA
jgi:sterol desaturase/sphingolipid hydroxylase (fatty acid hydroxylase superfamily)